VAHKTRKKLTKKEIKHDPVREKLEAGLIFIQTHQKEILGGLIVVVLIILVGQYMLARRNSAGEEAMAGFITASQLFTVYECCIDESVGTGLSGNGCGLQHVNADMECKPSE